MSIKEILIQRTKLNVGYRQKDHSVIVLFRIRRHRPTVLQNMSSVTSFLEHMYVASRKHKLLLLLHKFVMIHKGSKRE